MHTYSKLRVLSIIPTHNEIEFLPLQVAYLRGQGVDVFVIDNESTDGTYEWCRENGVPVEHLTTNGAFDLNAIQTRRRHVAELSDHEWIMYGDADEWNLFEDGIVATCQEATDRSAKVIRSTAFEFLNTGEPRVGSPLTRYTLGRFRYEDVRGITRLHRRGEVNYYADRFVLPNKPFELCAGLNLNWGNTKSPENRAATLARRQVAWERGLSRHFGSHYVTGQAAGWQWNARHLVDIRQTPSWPLASQVLDRVH